MRERYQAQAAEIQATRDELIHAESDLSALRLEKAEIGGSLLREKDDVRDLKRRVTEVTEEISSIKKEIEQAKKDARMQKGLLAIAKKQLSTAESDKEAAEKEMHEAREEAEKAEAEVAQTEAATATLKERSMSTASLHPEANGAAIVGFPNGTTSPIPAANSALPYSDASNVASPAPSIKSNNPFDRLRQSSVSDTTLPQRSASPFAASSLSAEPKAVDQADNDDDDDPFGFNEGSTVPQIPAADSTFAGTETPRQQSTGANGTTEKAASSPEHLNVISPSDAFFTPPTSSAGNNAIDAFFSGEQDVSASKFPALAEESHQSPKAATDLPPMTEIVENIDESSSDSDDDDRPLGQVKAEKQAANAEQPLNSGTVEPSFEDAFGLPAASKETPTATNTAPSSHFSTLGSEQVLSSPAVSTVPSSFAPAVNGHNTGE